MKILNLTFLYLVFLSLPIMIVAQSDTKDTMRFGSQTWTTRNLDVMTFSNGDPIPKAKSDKDWQKANETGVPAWCNSNDGFGGHGKLYNWYAVHDKRGLAPKGWHIPTESEWSTLINFLGGDSVAGGKLKDNYGFAAIRTDCRAGFGNFYFNNYGYFWSSSENQNNEALSFFLLFKDFNTVYLGGTNYNQVFHSYTDKASGLSVRCIKD